MDAPIITKFSQKNLKVVLGLRKQGYTVSRIATRIKLNHNTLRRYLRVYELYGEDAFIPRRLNNAG